MRVRTAVGVVETPDGGATVRQAPMGSTVRSPGGGAMIICFGVVAAVSDFGFIGVPAPPPPVAGFWYAAKLGVLVGVDSDCGNVGVFPPIGDGMTGRCIGDGVAVCFGVSLWATAGRAVESCGLTKLAPGSTALLPPPSDNLAPVRSGLLSTPPRFCGDNPRCSAEPDFDEVGDGGAFSAVFDLTASNPPTPSEPPTPCNALMLIS